MAGASAFARWWAGGLLAGTLAGAALAQPVDEALLKAAIVVNLLPFVEWPAAALPPEGGSLTVCVDRASSLAASLAALQGRQVQRRTLAVREPEAVTIAHCHVLVHAGAGRHAAAWRRRLGSAPVLVVSDAHPADDDVAVHLDIDRGRVVFDVRLSALRRGGLQLSSKLLRLAREVHE